MSVRPPRSPAVAVAAAVLAASVAGFLVVRQVVGFSSIDLRVYRVEGLAVRSHLDLYSALPTPHGLQATYPPFAALVFAPLSWLPDGAMPLLGLAVNLVLLLLVVRLSLRFASPSADPPTVAAVLLCAAVALWAEPVFLTLRNGQINLALLALVLWDFIRAARGRPFGVGIGLAAGLKVTPAIFIAYLLLTRRFRAAGTALASFATTVAVSAAVVPAATWRFWTHLVFDSGRVGDLEATGNQSVYGVVARLTHSRNVTPWETLGVLLVAVGGLTCAALAHRRLDDRWGVATCAVTALLISPIAWSHHWVWIVPIAALLWRHARAWLVPAGLLFLTQVIWLLPHGATADELSFSPGQIAVSASYAVFGVSLIAAVGWWIRAAGTQRAQAEAVRTASSTSSGGSQP